MAEDKDKTDSKADLANLGFSSNEMLTDYLEQLRAEPDSPEKEAKLRRLFQAYPQLEAIAGEDVSLGTDWLNTAMPEGRQVGERYIAANPLEFLSSALRQGAGAYQRKQGMDALRDLAEQRTEGVMDVGRNAAAYQGIVNSPPVGGYNLGDMKPQMRADDLSSLEHGSMTGYTPPADVQPNAGTGSGAETVIRAELADEMIDPVDDLSALHAASLRSKAQQEQSAQANPNLRMDRNFNVYEGLPANLQNQPIGMNPYVGNRRKQAMADEIFGSNTGYVVPKNKQVPVGYRRY